MLVLIDGTSDLGPSAQSLEAVVGVTLTCALYTTVFACNTKRKSRKQIASSRMLLNFCELMILPGKVEANPDASTVIYVSAMNT